MSIGVNKYQFYGKIVILSLILLLLIWLHPSSIKFDDASIWKVFFIVAVIFALVIMLFLMILQLFVLPKGVEIDEQSKILTLFFLTAKPLIIEPKDMNEFCSILITTKSTSYDGILLRLINGKEYVLSDFNLESSKPIKTFLEDANIANAGHYKFSFIFYFIRLFRY